MQSDSDLEIASPKLEDLDDDPPDPPEKRQKTQKKPSNRAWEECLAAIATQHQCLEARSDSRRVYCNACHSEFRGFRSDLEAHVAERKHQLNMEKLGTQSLVSLYGQSVDRTVEEAALDSKTLFRHNLVKHLLACGVPLSSCDRIFTDSFIAGLQAFGFELPGRTQLFRSDLKDAYSNAFAKIRNLVQRQPFSLLIDETPDVFGARIVACLISTPTQLAVLNVDILQPGATMDSKVMVETTLQAFTDFNLDAKQDFVAMISDNAKYGGKAWTLLTEQHPELTSTARKLSCISHVLNLVSKAFFPESLWPNSHKAISQLREFFGKVHGGQPADRVRRGARFHDKFQCSSRTVFSVSSTRWSDHMRLFHWIAMHLQDLISFLDTERQFYEQKLQAKGISAVKRQKTLSNIDTIRDLDSLLHSDEFTTEIQVLVYICVHLMEAVQRSQFQDLFQFLDIWPLIQGIMNKIHTWATKMPEVKRLVMYALNERTFPDREETRSIVKNVMAGATAAGAKWQKHTPGTIEMFEAIQCLIPSRWKSKIPQEIPEKLRQFLQPKEQLRAEIEWSILPSICDIGTATQTDTVKFWTSNSHKIPTLSRLATRLFAIRQGIADVERTFSLVRPLQTFNRLAASPETLKMEIWLVANQHIVDVFSV